ncbi:hypothetical protein GCM10025734_08860 [Kitasatospora paranensis]
MRTRVLAGAVAVAALGTVAVGAVSAGAGTGSGAATAVPVAAATAGTADLTTSAHLSVDAATRAARAALEAAQKNGQRVSVAVVDRDGNTVVALWGDGAGPQSPESARRKAFTAVSWNAPTSDLAKRLTQSPGLKDIPGTLFLAGAVPVTAKGAPVAAVGVAGAPSGDLDEQFARAGAQALSR